MAKLRILSCPPPVFVIVMLFFFFFFFSCTLQEEEAVGRRVGGRREVKDVENNKDIQDLGRFCVQEYNQQKAANGSSKRQLLQFSRVVEAETQVVSGIKYYLKISASKATFDAVVIVKPWMHHHSKELLNFTPSNYQRQVTTNYHSITNIK